MHKFLHLFSLLTNMIGFKAVLFILLISTLHAIPIDESQTQIAPESNPVIVGNEESTTQIVQDEVQSDDVKDDKSDLDTANFIWGGYDGWGGYYRPYLGGLYLNGYYGGAPAYGWGGGWGRGWGGRGWGGHGFGGLGRGGWGGHGFGGFGGRRGFGGGFRGRGHFG